MHTIHLRGPWRLTPLTRTHWTAAGVSEAEPGDLPPGGRLNPVGDWGPLLGGFRGRVNYERSFHRPTGLTGQQVFLVVENVDAFGRVQLNDHVLGELPMGEVLRVEITQLLQERNRLAIEIDLPRLHPASAPLPRGERGDDAPGGLIDGARLEILE